MRPRDEVAGIVVGLAVVGYVFFLGVLGLGVRVGVVPAPSWVRP